MLIRWIFSPHSVQWSPKSEAALAAISKRSAGPGILILLLSAAELVRTQAEFTMSAAAPDQNNASDAMSPANDSGNNNGHNAKRKSDDGAPQPRAKRNRYISIAWYGALSRLAH
jgi:hypothetical protein